ncbi:MULTISPECIES: Eco47II family restriction endonuclease [Flavobacterium]|uniref:Eco47II family restriction endonuclease n=1 Tax=Flavobacterium covae TaxID=2906076 RepID=A0ABW8PDI2_9FLAO|nr:MULTISPECIES: Eco47II family restriction endonuclease [Flavobacterium]AMA50048.1 restriction endonuclease [Flavobacterium covae]MCJ1808635.1 Eco47II family restriction endonuclease [Flavobacterium covae]OWP81938.1 restriction endonuclease [Flavobacterium covae]POR23280.1 restriction endonuclease [Flavobacterium columnare]
MTHKYVNFISDEHLLNCIENLHKAYLKAKNNISKKSFYTNKVDTIKLTFDSKFNAIEEELLIQSEILRQIDKSINNSIGTFHEQILGGVKGFEMGNLSGFDIKASDNTLFADIKNKHNTMNSSSSEALFQKLARYADDYKNAKCYWVQILAKGSFNELWKGDINGKEYSHSRVYKISGDKFYALVTGQEDAFFALYKVLPSAIDDYLKSVQATSVIKENSALEEITSATEHSNRTILDQITFDNYGYYSGFENL